MATSEESKNKNIQYVTDEGGKRVGVIMGIEEFERIMGDLEEIEDIRDAEELLDAIERGEEETMPWEQAKKEIEAEKAELRSRGEL